MAYGFYAGLTVDNTKVSGSSNLTNFPVLVSATFDGTGGIPDLRTTANGGNVQNTDTSGGNSGGLTVPADLVFSSDTAGASPYDFEVESYDASTGVLTAWVEITSLLYSSDTTFYVVYGDSSVTTSQEDIAGTWDANYVGVFHMNNDPTGTVYDSSSSPANLTPTNYSGGSAWASGDLVDAKVGKGITFEKSKKQYMQSAASVSKFNITGDLTLETVVTPVSHTEYGVFVAHGNGAVYWQYIFSHNTTPAWVFANSGGGSAVGSSGITDTNDYYFVGVKSGTQGDSYLNDSAEATDSTFNNPSSRTDELTVGWNFYDPDPLFLDSTISELRISNSARSTDWNTTNYNNLMDNANFLSIGSETAAGGGGGGFVLNPLILRSYQP